LFLNSFSEDMTFSFFLLRRILRDCLLVGLLLLLLVLLELVVLLVGDTSAAMVALLTRICGDDEDGSGELGWPWLVAITSAPFNADADTNGD
jgi:hypothetical protein